MSAQDDTDWIHDVGDSFQVRVTPNARANRIRAEMQPDGTLRIRAYVTVVPEDGKANKEVIRMLAKCLGVPPSALSIVRGAAGKDKMIRIERE